MIWSWFKVWDINPPSVLEQFPCIKRMKIGIKISCTFLLILDKNRQGMTPKTVWRDFPASKECRMALKQ
jgi:hypothetical protein